MVITKNIKKCFLTNNGDKMAVNGIDLNINKGEVFGLLGPNGAGKTTLLRMLSTVLTPTCGSAVVAGYNVIKSPNDVKKSIGFLSGNTKLYGRLTPRELMMYFGKLYDLDKTFIYKRIDYLVELFDMEKFVDTYIEKLSTGQVQRTSIARCIIHNPLIYIFDEPTLGLDILSSKTILEFIKSESQIGKTIIFSTHNMEEAEYLCNRIGLIYNGKLLDIKTLEEYKNETGKNNLSEVFLHYIKEKE